MSTSLRIQTTNGGLANLDGGVVVLREKTEYLVCGVPRTAEVRIGQLPLQWSAEHGAFALEIGFWFARQVLTVVDGATYHEIPLRVEADPRKLSSEAAAIMLRELEEWLPEITAGREGGTHGALRAGGMAAPMVAISLGPLVPALLRAMRSVLERPKQRRVDEMTDVALHAVRRVDPATLRWLSRHAGVFAVVEPRSLSAGAVQNPAIPQLLSADALDHPVNCYLVWGLHRVIALLRGTAEALELSASSRDVRPDSTAWYRVRAAELASGAEALRVLLRSSPLRSVPPAPPSESAILSLHDEPTYARAHAFLRLFLSPKFQLDDDPHPVAIRPSFELYELWTFLALRRALATVLAPSVVVTRGALELVQGTGRAAECTWQLEEGTLALSFQPLFHGYLARGTSQRFSISRERRPDLTIRWQPRTGPARWLCLDAKYRVDRDALADAFQSAHIYRDSLIWDDYGGRPIRALLLVPAILDECAPWFTTAFSDQYGCGVRRMTPGGASVAALAEEVLNFLEVGARRSPPTCP